MKLFALLFLLIAFVSSEENGKEFVISSRSLHFIFIYSHLIDIEELSLTFNQIKNLIANFNNDNLLKAVKFAEDTIAMSKK